MRISPRLNILAMGLISIPMITLILSDYYLLDSISFQEGAILLVSILTEYILVWNLTKDRWFPFLNKKDQHICSNPSCSNDIEGKNDDLWELIILAHSGLLKVFDSYCVKCRKLLYPRFVFSIFFMGWNIALPIVYINCKSFMIFEDLDQSALSFLTVFGLSLIWGIIIWFFRFSNTKSSK